MAAKKAPQKPKFTPRPYKPRKPKPKSRRTDDEILADARKELKKITEGPKFSHRPYKPKKTSPSKIPFAKQAKARSNSRSISLKSELPLNFNAQCFRTEDISHKTFAKFQMRVLHWRYTAWSASRPFTYLEFLKGPFARPSHDWHHPIPYVASITKSLNTWLCRVPALLKEAKRHEVASHANTNTQRNANIDLFIDLIAPKHSIPVSAEFPKCYPNPAVVEAANSLYKLRSSSETLRLQIRADTDDVHTREEIQQAYSMVDYAIKWTTQLMLCRLGAIIYPI